MVYLANINVFCILLKKHFKENVLKKSINNSKTVESISSIKPTPNVTCDHSGQPSIKFSKSGVTKFLVAKSDETKEISLGCKPLNLSLNDQSIDTVN